MRHSYLRGHRRVHPRGRDDSAHRGNLRRGPGTLRSTIIIIRTLLIAVVAFVVVLLHSAVGGWWDRSGGTAEASGETLVCSGEAACTGTGHVHQETTGHNANEAVEATQTGRDLEGREDSDWYNIKDFR